MENQSFPGDDVRPLDAKGSIQPNLGPETHAGASADAILAILEVLL
jgi:hypothetical protein